ncbi:MAG TPA: EamA family transporter, partial [Actinomycetota bacterium]|nr:EamA family transporter [Actinomycetota bacterium]
RVDLGCALLAGGAVIALTRPQPTTDYLGIALALVAAGCWASYILLNRVIGRRLPGTEGSAAAAGLSALLYVPVGIVTLLRHPPTVGALGYAAAAGVLSSTVPFLADLLALRRVPARFFGVFMSVNPVLAALVGLAILDQSLGWVEWLAITTIVTANTVSVAVGQAEAQVPADREHNHIGWEAEAGEGGARRDRPAGAVSGSHGRSLTARPTPHGQRNRARQGSRTVARPLTMPKWDGSREVARWRDWSVPWWVTSPRRSSGRPMGTSTC